MADRQYFGYEVIPDMFMAHILLMYIKNIADSVQSGSLDLMELHTLPDEEVCRQLSQIK